MSQNIVNYGDNPTGPQLLDNYLAKDQENCLTTNSGIQRPSYATAGTLWINTSSTPWVLYVFDGTNDVSIGTINPTTHEFISSNFADVVNLTTAQSVAGVKTFELSPVIPTPSTSDNSTKAANTKYVRANTNGAISTVRTSNLTVNKAVISNSSGKLATSSVSDTELGYLSGATSNIQTQINTKAHIEQVNSLPADPDANTWYAIPEA